MTIASLATPTTSVANDSLMKTHVQWLSEQIVAEAGEDFDAWREENDPLHSLPIEEAAERYFRDRLAQ